MNILDTDKGMLVIKKAFEQLRKTQINVGVFSDAVNDKGADKVIETVYIADYAITNEYGSGRVPERSFLRSTASERQDQWSRLMADAFTNISKNGGRSLDNDLYRLGAVARSDIIAKINSNINPPNAPSTIKRKKNKSRTLIEHGILRSSIEARISKSQ